MSLVAVIDCGMGNIHSIKKALQVIAPKIKVQVTSDANTIQQADRIVLPGVGAIKDYMQALTDLNLLVTIKVAAKTKPFLGICVGMQALLTYSEENNGSTCLDIISGHVVRFSSNLTHDNNILKIPHIGWNQVLQKPHPLWKNIALKSRFYFVHSYYAKLDNNKYTIATTDYPQAFTSALAKDNIFAVQFHPEKSQTAGLQLLNNFLSWDGNY